jgi:predicted permease
MSDAYLVRIEALEKIDSLLEIITDFFLGLVVAVAVGLDGVDASACIVVSVGSELSDRHKRTVFVPLVLPEALVIALVVLPVGLHVGQQLGPTLRLEDLRDVRILARRITELLVRAVTVVGPGPIVSDPIASFSFC